MRAINLLLLGAMIGVELILGVVVAPVIFYPQNLIGENVLSHFQSGLIMTKIFIQMGYVLVAVSIINFIFEFYYLFDKETKFKLKFSKFTLSLLILALSLLFVFYFTENIVKMQTLEESVMQTEVFKALHSASEIVIKIVLVMQIFLYFLSFKIAKKV